MDTREIAEELLRRRLATSHAGNPWYSLATTIEKNIREGRYNEPKLALVLDERGLPVHAKNGRRLIQRAPWVGAPRPAKIHPVSENQAPAEGAANGPYFTNDPDDAETLLLRVPKELLGHIQLAQLAGFGATREEAALLLLQRGVNASKEEIGTELKQRFKI